MPVRPRGATALATLLCLAVLAAACSSNTSSGPGTSTGTAVNSGIVESAEKPVPGGAIAYGLVAESNGWNPGANQWAPSGLQVTRAIFDTLTTYDADSKVVANLAQAVDHNADYTAWTITLRPNIKFHDGSPVTSDSVRRDMEYFKASPITKDAFAIMDTFKTDGDLKLVIGLSQRWVNLPVAFATQIGVVAEPNWLESNDGLHPIGTGPFKLTDWKIGESLTVKKNVDYWRKDEFGTQLPYLDSIQFKILTDEAARSVTLKTNGIDIAEISGASQIADFQERGQRREYQVFSNTGGETAEVFVMLNTAAAPFDDIDARRALAYATDKQPIVDTLGGGLFEPADGPYAPSSPWYVKTDYPQFDLAKAKELADKVKAAHGSFTFDISGPADAGVAAGLQTLQAQWAEAGITANIVTGEQSTGIINVILGKYQATIWQQFDSPSPISEVVWWIPGNAKAVGEFSLNFTRNKDQQIADAATVLTQNEDPKAQLEQFKVLQQRLAADVPYVWLYHTQLSIVASNKLVNVMRNTLPDKQTGLQFQSGSHALSQIWIRP